MLNKSPFLKLYMNMPRFARPMEYFTFLSVTDCLLKEYYGFWLLVFSPFGNLTQANCGGQGMGRAQHVCEKLEPEQECVLSLS